MNKALFPLAAALTGLLAPCGLRADVKLPAIFGDHMVLQQEAKLPVWGRADPGEKVAVAFGPAKAEATAGADGKWRVDLPALPAGTPPGTLTVAGKNTITIADVLVGEVWLCSGQSNMEFGVGNLFGARELVAQADNPQLRLFLLPKTPAVVPQEDCPGQWVLCTPDTVMAGGWKGFSAVAYFFGLEIQRDRKVPVGLVESAFGGSHACQWTELSAFEADPVLQHYADSYKAAAAEGPVDQAEFVAKVAAYDAASAQWTETMKADTAYQAALKASNDAIAQAKAAGQPAPPPPAPYPVPHPAPVKINNAPTLLFNGMIAPLVPFAIRGAIWYQGESDAGNALEYRTLFPAMIADWRARWGEGNFPFLFVQLANYMHPPRGPGDASNWALMRESQLKSLSVPNTGMAVAIDVGDEGIHPFDKFDVGLRLSLVARHVVYGENLVYTGPLYDSMKVEDGKVRVSFRGDSIGGGLVIGGSPATNPRAVPVSKTDLQSFAVAGADQKWAWADAKIDGATVVVSSPQVPNPVAVRYAWGDNPPCNLYNQAGLPASPFRTDEWGNVPPVPAAK